MAELPKLSVRLSGAVDPRQCLELARIAEAAARHGIELLGPPGTMPA